MSETPQLPQKAPRRLALGLALVAGLISAEEVTIGLIRSRFSAAVQDPAPTTEVTVVSQPEKKQLSLTIDGLTFVSDTFEEEELRAAYALAQQKIGGPYITTDKPLRLEKVDPTRTVSITSVREGFIETTPQALPHELIHLLLGVPEGSEKWPHVLGEFFGHAASPREPYRYRIEDLDHDFISMFDPDAASETNRNFFYDMRREAMRQMADSIDDQTRQAIVRAALAREKISFEELPQFLEQFGVRHAIFQKGKPDTLQAIVYCAFEDGREAIIPVVYGRLADKSERPLEGKRLTLVFMNKAGGVINKAALEVGQRTHTPNIQPIMLKKFLEFYRVDRGALATIYVEETGQTIELPSRN